MTSQPSRQLGNPGFGSDLGDADPAVASALSAYANGQGGSADVLAALAVSRLLVPVVAVTDSEPSVEAGPDGPQVEKASSVATVSTTGRDGRSGLLAFTCVETMRRWNRSARPVPVTSRRAAETALAERADALVIDLAGPVTFAVDAAELRALAAGWRPVGEAGGGPAWAVSVGLTSTARSQDEAPVATGTVGHRLRTMIGAVSRLGRRRPG